MSPLTVNNSARAPYSLFSCDFDAVHRHRQRPQCGRTGRQVHVVAGRPDHRHRLLQGAAEHRNPCRRLVERDRHAARHRDLHQRDGERLAAGQFRHAGHDHRRNDLCRLLPYQCRRIFGRSEPVRQRGHQRAAHRAVLLGQRRQWRLRLWRPSLFPTNSYNATSYGVDVVFKPQLAG